VNLHLRHALAHRFAIAEVAVLGRRMRTLIAAFARASRRPSYQVSNCSVV
jgi:hypothetical protein